MDPVRGDKLAEAQLHALVGVAAAAAGAHRLDDVLELAAERSRAAIGAASLAISRWEAGYIVTLINVGDLGPGEERFPEDERYPLWRFPTTARVLEGGGMMVTTVDDPDCDPAHRDLLLSLGKESSLTVPIRFERATWGELWATSAIGEPRFTAGDAVFLRAIAGQIGAALARAELFAQIEALAYTDALTGLANRRVLERALEQACEATASPGSPALLLCDIDGLKAINDGAGHEAGDRVIVLVAAALRGAAAVHTDAVVSRIGGDEFCVLLPSGDAGDAHRLSKDLARRIEAAEEPGLTASCGIAAHGPNVEGPAALMRAADFAQYRAKRTGPAVNAEIAGPHSPELSPRSGDRLHRDSDARRRLADELLALLGQAGTSSPEAQLALLRGRLAEETHAVAEEPHPAEQEDLPSAS